MMEGNIARKKLNATAEARIVSEPLVIPFQKNPATSESGSFSKPGRIILLEFVTIKVIMVELRMSCMILGHMKRSAARSVLHPLLSPLFYFSFAPQFGIKNSFLKTWR